MSKMQDPQSACFSSSLCPSSGAMRTTNILHSLSWDSDGESVAPIFSYSCHPPFCDSGEGRSCSTPSSAPSRQKVVSGSGRENVSTSALIRIHTSQRRLLQLAHRRQLKDCSASHQPVVGAAPVSLLPTPLALEKSLTGLRLPGFGGYFQHLYLFTQGRKRT